MCTVSWLYAPGGYHLLCNRDEKRTRVVAEGPRRFDRGGVSYLAPIDPVGGGTWIAVNEYGVSGCLLNGNGEAGILSRGLLVNRIATSRSAEEAVASLRGLDPGPYGPFRLLLLAPEYPPTVAEWTVAEWTVAEWDGRNEVRFFAGAPRMPLVSSSFEPAAVEQARREEFQRRLREAGKLDLSFLQAFHRSHQPARGPYSSCMHRPDAETVSFSWIHVTNRHIEFAYLPGAPCQPGPGQTSLLKRRA